VPLLTGKIKWRIMKVSGEVVPDASLPSLKVDVESFEISLPLGATIPTYSEPKYYPGITGDYAST